MSSLQTGFLQVHAYASNAELPLKDVSILILDDQEKTIAVRMTDRNGKVIKIPISAPDPSTGQVPGPDSLPYTKVSLIARMENYEQIYIKNIQIFPDIVTKQNLEMTPLAEFPGSWEKGERFDTYSQSL